MLFSHFDSWVFERFCWGEATRLRLSRNHNMWLCPSRWWCSVSALLNPCGGQRPTAPRLSRASVLGCCPSSLHSWFGSLEAGPRRKTHMQTHIAELQCFVRTCLICLTAEDGSSNYFHKPDVCFLSPTVKSEDQKSAINRRIKPKEQFASSKCKYCTRFEFVPESPP